MADFQRVVEFLRDIRQGPLQTVTEEITQLAAEYAALCVQANERLRRCTSYLQQGLRSEAIHLAEESPNLLDLVAALDLPDQQAWMEFCQNNGLAVPPPLQLDRAAQLNEAYAQDQPMEHLLAQHRLLALSRAPVRERLGVLRKISQVDATNPMWEKDIRVFEQARLKELPAMFYSAVKNRDEGAIVALMDEVGRQHWYEPVPPDLAAAVGDAYARVQRANVEAELRKLVEPLRDAYAARSVQECQALVQRWRKKLTDAGVSQIAPELSDEIRPVVTFIQEQARREEVLKRFRDACRAFTHLLDHDAPDQQLETVYSRLKEFNEEIPAELTQRYMAKKAGRQHSAERRHRVRLVTIGSVAAGVIVVMLVSIFLYMRSSQARTAEQKINASVNLQTEAGMRAAAEYVDSLRKTNPGLLEQAGVAAAVSRLQAQQTEFESDTQAAAALARRGEEARTSVSGVIGNPAASMMEIGRAGDDLQRVLEETAAARKTLAWADPGNRLGASESTLRSSLAVLKDRVASAATREMDEITGKLDKIPTERSTVEGASEARAQVALLTQRVNALADLPLLDPEMKNAIAGLSQRIAQRRQGTEASRTVAEELETIRQRSDSPGALQAALEAFIRRFPEDPRTREFTEALSRISMGSAIEAWRVLLVSLEGRPEAPSHAVALKRLEAVNAYLAAHPDTPLGVTVAQYAEYLRQAAGATAERGTWQTAFADLAATPLLTELGVMEVSDGRRYYTLGDVRRTERRINAQVSVSFQALDPKDLTRRQTVVIDPPLTVSDRPAVAPHVKAMTEVLDRFKLINEENWDSLGIDIADRLVRNDQMDPVVKAILLLRTLRTQTAVAGWALGDTYARPIATLARQSPEQLPFQDPGRISEGTLQAIRQAIAEMPTTAAVKQKLVTGRTNLFKSIAFDSLGSGVLLKDDAGEWHVYSRAPMISGSMIWTVVPPAAGSQPPVPPPAAAPIPPAPPPTPAPPAAAAPQATTAGGEAAAATEPAAPAGAPSAPTAPTMPPPPAIHPGSLQLVGTVTGNNFTLNNTMLRGIPQGSIVFITRP